MLTYFEATGNFWQAFRRIATEKIEFSRSDGMSGKGQAALPLPSNSLFDSVLWG